MISGKIKAIDMFCGAGGSSFGATLAGIDVIAGLDMWDPAIKTYKENFPNAKVYKENLQVITDEKIRSIKSEIGNVELILASPECTNHSKAKGAADRSELSKETAFEVIRFARIFTPSWIVIENVVEMQRWFRFNELIDELWNLKYFVKKVILNSKDYGVPQKRERLFLLCSLSGLAKELPENNKPVLPVSTILNDSGLYSFSPLFRDGRAKNTLDAANRAIDKLGQNNPFLLVYYGSARKGNGGWQKVSEPLGTITTLDRFAYVIPEKNGYMMRMLQPAELKLAMGFVKEFKLESIDGITRRDRIKLMGNGVCPPVMEAILRSLIING